MTAWYVFAGAPKCGSTWMYEQLRRHPQIATASGKDTYYFTSQWHRSRDWYLRHFTPGPDTQCYADISHHYMYEPDFVSRLRATVDGDVRVHLMLRDPAQRLRSALEYQRAVDGRNADFDDPHVEFVDQGRYAPVVDRLRRELSPDELRIDVFEDFFARPRESLMSLLDWIHPDTVDSNFATRVEVAPIRAARRARLGPLNRTAKAAARGLRLRGRGRLVGVIKQSRVVDRALYRGDHVDRGPARDEVVQRFRALYRDDVDQLRELLDVDLGSIWPEYWAGR